MLCVWNEMWNKINNIKDNTISYTPYIGQVGVIAELALKKEAYTSTVSVLHYTDVLLCM